MKTRKTAFALFFGNRGFFPASLQKVARREMAKVLRGLGYKVLMLPESATRHGAVETPEEGKIYADFLRENRGKYDGVILCLPNFGDETGAVAALKDAGVPILIQAYPDELDKMAPHLRRDAFCGKFSIMDVFCQYDLPFTALKPHTVDPNSKKFQANVDYFERVCRVVNALKEMVVGAIGARTTAFKTVRIDELALQKHGITMETLDLSDIFARVKGLKTRDPKVRAKATKLRAYTSWNGVPDQAFENIVKLGVVLDQVVNEYAMDAVSVRCWREMQEQLGVSPCVLLSEMNDRGLATACEVDVGNAVMMYALSKASGNVPTCLDWNNNYGDDENKCILFHCGGCSYGCNVGRIAPTPFTFGSLLTRDGDIECYIGQGRFTPDPIPEDFFGCAGVAHIPNLQDALQTIGHLGHRHHTSVTPGQVLEPLSEALNRYLGYDVTIV